LKITTASLRSVLLEAYGEREEFVRRMRGQFEEMLGLSLTSVQAIKLFGISPDVCAGILSHLIEEGVLRLKSDGRYTCRIERA